MALITYCIRDGIFVWTLATSKVFDLIKEKLSSAPILALSDFTMVLNCIVTLQKWVVELYLVGSFESVTNNEQNIFPLLTSHGP